MPVPDYDQAEGICRIPAFRFASGDVLDELRLRYLTLGQPRLDAAGRIENAVLMLHGTTSTSANFLRPSVAGHLFGNGQPLDATRYFIILPDDIGHGGSSRPSEGRQSRFPRFGYHDCVTAQHHLITEHLGVGRLKLLFGYSMGGMQGWLWTERYPDAMEAMLPLACQPAPISGRNLLFRRIITQAIRSDPGWRGGQYAERPRGWLHAAAMFPLMTDSPVALQAQAPDRAASEALFQEICAQAAANYDPCDLLYWLEASGDYDPEPALERVTARVLAVNFADDMINPPGLGVMERAIAKVRRGRYVLIPESSRTKGHQTVFLASVWQEHVRELLEESRAAG